MDYFYGAFWNLTEQVTMNSCCMEKKTVKFLLLIFGWIFCHIKFSMEQITFSVYLYMNLFIDLFFCLHKDISSVKDVWPSLRHINPPQGICACLRRCCHADAVPDRIQAGLREHSNTSDVLVLTAVLSSCSIMWSLGLKTDGIERYSPKPPILNLEQYHKSEETKEKNKEMTKRERGV